jgi:hypothetical protein
MKKNGILLLLLMVITLPTVAAFTPGIHVVTPPPPAPPTTPPNINNMMGPAANNVIGTALDLKEKAHSLFDQAEEQDLDVSEFEDILEEADALLEMAQKIARVNPIPAGNMAREAANLYEQIISDLEALLG